MTSPVRAVSDLILPRPQATTPALARDSLLVLSGSMLVALLGAHGPTLWFCWIKKEESCV